MSAAIRLARGHLAHALLTDACTIVTPGATTPDGGGGFTEAAPTTRTEPCSFAEVSGDEATTDVIAVRGRYALGLRAAVTIDATCRVQYQGAVYRVVWAPPINARGLTRTIGLEDAPGVAFV